MKHINIKNLILSSIAIFIAILLIYSYLIKPNTTINLETISLPNYDINTYTIVSRSKIQIIDEDGKVLNKYNIENTISTEDTKKNYDSSKMWFRSSDFTGRSNLFGYYDLGLKELNYSQYSPARNIESPMFLESNIEDRYKFFAINKQFYIYDIDLNKGIKLTHSSYGSPTFIQLSETTGFFNDTSPEAFCFIDFENQEIKYPDFSNSSGVSGICGIYDNKLIASTWNNEFILIDENFNITKLCDNITSFDNTYISNMYFINEDIIMVEQTELNTSQEIRPVQLDYINLNSDKKELTRLSTIDNNGYGFFDITYADSKNVYLYSYAKKDEHKFLVLDIDTFEVVKEIPIDKSIIEAPSLEIPLIIKN